MIDIMGIIKKITSPIGRGKTMYDALKKEMQGESGARVSALVRSAPYLLTILSAEDANNIALYVMRENQKGRRAESIAKDLENMLPDHAEDKALLIARTQASIAHTALTRARAEKMGLRWYVWHACGERKGDGKTWDSHCKMNGIVVNWSDPPAPKKLFPSTNAEDYGHYHAGCCPLCRCYAEPVVDEDLLKYPVKVHISGKIYKMTKIEFRKIMNRHKK